MKPAALKSCSKGSNCIRWEDYIGRKDAFPVKGGWSLKSQLYSIPDCQSIIKKVIVTRLQQAYGVSWFEEERQHLCGRLSTTTR